MIEREVIIVGGGPGGSSTALRLSLLGIPSTILDKSTFPRVKLCAGWITPRIHSLLKMEHYPYGILELRKINFTFYTKKQKEISFSAKTKQYSIRRYEFDHWLLEMSRAEFFQHQVKNIEVDEDGYFVIDNEYRAKFLVGAGGTYCPVYRKFFHEQNPRSKEVQIAALEIEFPYEYQDQNCYLWFFENGLPGYSWYVPKANGYLNIGIGAFSHFVKPSLHWHFDHFITKLKKLKLLNHFEQEPKGHTYYLREKTKNIQNHRVFLVGDAAGLATFDLGEGIGPAIESGFQVADVIAKHDALNLNKIPFSSNQDFGRLFSFLMNQEVYERFYAFPWNWKEKVVYAILKLLQIV